MQQEGPVRVLFHNLFFSVFLFIQGGAIWVRLAMVHRDGIQFLARRNTPLKLAAHSLDARSKNYHLQFGLTANDNQL